MLIDPGGPGTGDETYLRENIAMLELYGALARASSRLGGAHSPWSTEVAVEYTRGEQESDFVDPGTGDKPFDDVPAQRIPPLHGWIGLRRDTDWTWLDGLALTAAWAAEQDRLSPQDLSDPRIDPEGTGGWVTLDLDLDGPSGSGAGGSRWFLGVHNVLDESYRIHGSGFDSPGVGVGVRLSR